MVRKNGRLCGCGKTGCLEAYASATGVARTARELLEATDRKSVLRNMPAESITSKDVFEAAMEGDELAKEIFAFTGNMLGEALADFIAFSSPEAIVLFGGLTRSGDLIMKPVVESMNANVMPQWRNKIKVVFSQLKESDAAILGASALAWEIKED
jgi:glucokinase